MITKRMLLILGTMQRMSAITVWWPLEWDKARERVNLSPKWKFAGYILYTFYLCCYAFALFIRVGVAFMNQQKYEVKHILTDFCFVSIVIADLSIAKLIISNRYEYAEWINQTINLDMKLQQLSRSSFKRNASKAKHKYLEMQKMFTELLMLLISFGQVSAVVLVTILFVEGSDPTSRFISEVFGVKIVLKLSHLPVILSVSYLIWMCTSTCVCLLFWGLVQLHVSSYWLKALAPMGMNVEVSRNGRFALKKTALGYINDKTCLRIHKTLEVLMKYSKLDEPVVGIHVATCFVIIVATGFATVKLFDAVGMPAYLICPAGVVFASAVIDFESILYSIVCDASEGVLQTLKQTYGRKSLPAKELRGHRVINVTPGKPFFVMGRSWSLDFNMAVVDHIIEVIMSVET